MNENVNSPVKWLQYLLYVAIIAAVKKVLGTFLSGTLLSLIGSVCGIASAVFIFCLAKNNDRYKKSAVFSVIGIVSAALSAALPLLTLVSYACILLAEYQEYHAHGMLVEERNPELAKKWRGLFGMRLAVSLVVPLLGSVIGALLIMAANFDDTASGAVIQFLGAAMILSMELLYLSYLNRTIKAVTDEFVV